jgi:hypothetical protein
MKLKSEAGPPLNKLGQWRFRRAISERQLRANAWMNFDDEMIGTTGIESSLLPQRLSGGAVILLVHSASTVVS